MHRVLLLSGVCKCVGVGVPFGVSACVGLCRECEREAKRERARQRNEKARKRRILRVEKENRKEESSGPSRRGKEGGKVCTMKGIKQGGLGIWPAQAKDQTNIVLSSIRYMPRCKNICDNAHSRAHTHIHAQTFKVSYRLTRTS